ncbi:hypothetical protein D3C84_846370 [compost metagenome]
MRTVHARHAAGQGQHLFADIAGQFLVHQDRCTFPGDLQRAPEYVQGNAQAEEGVQLRPAQACQDQGNQDAAVEQKVGTVMQRVGTHRGGAGDAYHPGLQRQQGHRQRQ